MCLSDALPLRPPHRGKVIRQEVFPWAGALRVEPLWRQLFVSAHLALAVILISRLRGVGFHLAVLLPNRTGHVGCCNARCLCVCEPHSSAGCCTTRNGLFRNSQGLVAELAYPLFLLKVLSMSCVFISPEDCSSSLYSTQTEGLSYLCYQCFLR